MNKFKKITKEFNYIFNTAQTGLYSIVLEATCKSGKILGLFGGEDLRVEIDEIKLREVPAKRKPQYFNIPPSWNGTRLKGLSKIVVFILRLNKGEHIVRFIPKRGATIEREPEIKPFNSPNKILQNIQAQDSNRRPWIALSLIDLPLKILDTSVVCKKRRRDSDDIKLVIDGKVQKNEQAKIWGKNWYWRGSQLRGDTKEDRFYSNWPPGIHYIELWADRMPVLNEVKLDLGSGIEDQGEEASKVIKPYIYKGPDGKQNYNRYDELIEEIVRDWNRKFLTDKYYPVKESLDPNLVKAIIYQESKMGYYPGGETDIMQVGHPDDPALKTLNGESEEWEIKDGKLWRMDYDGEANANSPENSIHWGVRWLYHKDQGITKDNKKYWRSWKEAVYGYGPNTKKYVNEVWKIYTKAVDPEGNVLWEQNKNGFSLIKILLSIGLALLLFSVGYYYGGKVGDDYYSQKEFDEYLAQQKEGLSQEEIDSIVKKIFLKNLEQYKKGYTPYNSVFKEAIDKCAELNCIGPLVFYWHYEDLVKHMQTDQQFIEAASSLGLIDRTYQRDIDNDGENEIIFSRIDLPNREFVSFAIIDKIDDNYKIIENKIDGGHNGYIELLDVTGDLHPEVAFFIGFGKGGYKLFIYEYQEDKKSKEIFSSRDNDIYSSNYTFSDLDNDNRIEIKINGEIRYTLEHGKKVQMIYEYDPNKNTFKHQQKTSQNTEMLFMDNGQMIF